MNSPDRLKQAAAQAALAYVVPGEVLGVGTGSTANYFIDALAEMRADIPAAVASSEASAARLHSVGIAVTDLMHVAELAVYIDGADEIDGRLRMIKGGGGALTREKIVASVARRFICIADGSKYVSQLGRFPLPVEVVPVALGPLLRRFHSLGARAKLREGFQTDNGNFIIDVTNLNFEDPLELEREINQWPGVVTNGIFALRAADVLLLATQKGVKIFTPGVQVGYAGE